MKAWQKLDSRSVFRNPVLELHQERVRTPRGDETDWTVVEIGDGVCVVPLRPDGGVHMIRQYRHAVGEWVLEFPAGRVEPGEDPEAAGRRELAEEAGLEADAWQGLGAFWPLDGVCRHRIHLFLARGLTPTAPGHETFEAIEPRDFGPEALRDALEVGDIRCGIALAALARVFLVHSEGAS
ncbi:MAG: NUDIX hydrolase [Planctomycetes bacterium]|nr:NUDIX hydrolase [Planctomycetota bacterium]